MGNTEAPEEGKKVAGTIFGAVFVYIVRDASSWSLAVNLIDGLGILSLLRCSGIFTLKRKSERSHFTFLSNATEAFHD